MSRLQQPVDSMVVVGTAGGGALGWWSPDAFFWLILLLVATNLADWLLGRHAARAGERFNRTKARSGLASKGAQMVVLLSVRSLEAVVPTTADGLPSTGGVIAVAIGAALVIEEIQSIERHRISLGAQPIPLLSWALGRLSATTGTERRTKDQGPPAGTEERRGAV